MLGVFRQAMVGLEKLACWALAGCGGLVLLWSRQAMQGAAPACKLDQPWCIRCVWAIARRPHAPVMQVGSRAPSALTQPFRKEVVSDGKGMPGFHQRVTYMLQHHPKPHVDVQSQ